MHTIHELLKQRMKMRLACARAEALKEEARAAQDRADDADRDYGEALDAMGQMLKEDDDDRESPVPSMAMDVIAQERAR